MTSMVMAGGSVRRCSEALVDRMMRAYYAEDRDDGDGLDVACAVCGRAVPVGEAWPSDDGPLCDGCYMSRCLDG